MLLYRNQQARDLLSFPDLSGGDYSSEERQQALRQYVSIKQPLTAVALFLGIVALEDFVRDLGGRLAENQRFVSIFPGLTQLAMQQTQRTNRRTYERIDREPVAWMDPEKVNSAFMNAIGTTVISEAEYAKLRDLGLIRHTVAHHGALVRVVDLPRFQYWRMVGLQPLNPPPEFVEELLGYLWSVCSSIQIRVRNTVLSKLLEGESANWHSEPSQHLLDALEFFDYFGFIETAYAPVGSFSTDPQIRHRQEQDQLRIRRALIKRCLDELQNPTTESVPRV